MPVSPEPAYRPPWYLRHGHSCTILPVFTRKVSPVPWRRERIDTPDGDFLDVDWSEKGHDRVAILSHGLEGSTRGKYIQGMAQALNANGWDAVGWNCRGCSGEINRCLRLYHSGSTDDLDTVVQHVLRVRPDARLALIGFSLGGNMTLKYVGERGADIHPRVRGAVAFSVPCDLTSSSVELGRWYNYQYMIRFMVSLQKKIRIKEQMFPGQVKSFSLINVHTFKQFDDRYTAPMHGFTSAEDYWLRASSKPFLSNIRIPTLLVNAHDDPFLAPPCFPYGAADESPYFWLEVPRFGGHCSFPSEDLRNPYWSDRRAVEFLAPF